MSPLPSEPQLAKRTTPIDHLSMKPFITRYSCHPSRRAFPPSNPASPSNGTKTITETSQEAADHDAVASEFKVIPRKRDCKSGAFLTRYIEQAPLCFGSPTAGTKTATAVATEAHDQDYHFGITVLSRRRTRPLSKTRNSRERDLFVLGTQTVTKVAQEGSDSDARARSYRAIQ